MEKRKIIEIYAEENVDTDTVTFDFTRVEDSKVANRTMKMLVDVFTLFDEDGELGVTEDGEPDE